MEEIPAVPDAWAVEAARLPLAFSQVREDPRLDLQLLQKLPAGAEIVMIASGGETLVPLARMCQGRIHAVDMNAAQLTLARCKLQLAGCMTADDICRLLGHEPMPAPARRAALRYLLEALHLPEDTFGPPDFVSEYGPDHAGRYERCFAELRAEIARGAPRDDALRKVMSRANLETLFGQEAAQNPRRPFHEHFAWRSRAAFARNDAEVNPFLLQMYAGRFAPGHRYDWLEDDSAPAAAVVWHHGRMTDVLDSLPRESAGLVHLSNILDWLSPEQATRTLAAAVRVLQPGGWIIVRQLNSSLQFETLTDAVAWDHVLGQRMAEEDRSFFYPNLFAGVRR